MYLTNTTDSFAIQLGAGSTAAAFMNGGTSYLGGAIGFGGANPPASGSMSGTATTATGSFVGINMTLNSSATGSTEQVGFQGLISATSTTASRVVHG